MTKKAILDLLMPRLREQGFRQSDSLFYKKVNGAEAMFTIAFSNYGTIGRASATISVGIEAIQEVLRYQKGLFHNAPEHVASLAIGLQEYEYRNDDAETLLICTSRLLKDFRTKAVPFFATYRNVSDIDVAINSEASPFPVNRGNVALNCCNGVAAAYFSSQPGTTALVARYRNLVEQYSRGFYLSAFDSVVERVSRVAQHGVQADILASGRFAV